MRKPRWAYVVMLLVGAGLGVAIAGVPSREQDPPLRVQTESTTTTVAPTPTTASPATEAPPTTAAPSGVAPPPTTPRRPTPTNTRRR